ncbi:MAG: hypothetical protein D3909_19235 [Candidatus Electrothrix sp. ATG1]|nr:hypothetical protein [Candidatus Electrothrix sp. ATG1]
MPGSLKKSSTGRDWQIKKRSAPLDQKITQTIKQAAAQMRKSRVVNNSTCGRPWKQPLTEIQGRVRNVEYRVQPFTGRRGLHIDVATGSQQDTVIHVYPQRLTAKCPSVFHFTVGESITVTGSEFFTGRGGSEQNICAAVLTQGKKKLAVRDSVSGDLERHLCCSEICEKNCAGLPPMCDMMCMGNCRNRKMMTVFRDLPFCPSCDEKYTTTTFDY